MKSLSDRVNGWVNDLGTLINAAALVGILLPLAYKNWTAVLVVAAVYAIYFVLYAHGKRLRPDERLRLCHYYKSQIAALLSELPAGGEKQPEGDDAPPTVRYEHYVQIESLYAEPQVTLGRASATANLGVTFVKYLDQLICESERVAILGTPGQGKTLSARLVFRSLAYDFISAPLSAPLPIYVKMVDERLDGKVASLRHGLDQLRATANIPISSGRLASRCAKGGVVLIFDGVDEYPGDLAEVATTFWGYRVLITCRRDYYEVMLKRAPQIPHFRTVVIDGVDFHSAGKSFVEKYCRKFDLANAGEVVEQIERSRSLLDIVKRPLLLFMTTDILANRVNEREGVEPHEWTVARVYQLYTRRWMLIEYDKNLKLPAENLLPVVSAAAWEIYKSSDVNEVKYSSFNVDDLVISRANLQAVISKFYAHVDIYLPEITRRTFLQHSDTDGERGQWFRFVHKSFFEFFAATFVVQTLTQFHRSAKAGDLLRSPLPDEVIDFVRQLMQEESVVPAARRNMRANLSTVLREASSEALDDLMARQQAANLFPNVLLSAENDMDGHRQILDAYRKEEHPFIRRGIAVGMQLRFPDDYRQMLDELLEELNTNPTAVSFHMGYNRIYYGDQAPGKCGWSDDGGRECERFFSATLQQLENDFYRGIWPMSVWTLRAILADNERRNHLQSLDAYCDASKRIRSFVVKCVEQDWGSLSGECERLLREVERYDLGESGGYQTPR